jgi:hypothetical protein
VNPTSGEPDQDMMADTVWVAWLFAHVAIIAIAIKWYW